MVNLGVVVADICDRATLIGFGYGCRVLLTQFIDWCHAALELTPQLGVLFGTCTRTTVILR